MNSATNTQITPLVFPALLHGLPMIDGIGAHLVVLTSIISWIAGHGNPWRVLISVIMKPASSTLTMSLPLSTTAEKSAARGHTFYVEKDEKFLRRVWSTSLAV